MVIASAGPSSRAPRVPYNTVWIFEIGVRPAPGCPEGGRRNGYAWGEGLRRKAPGPVPTIFLNALPKAASER